MSAQRASGPARLAAFAAAAVLVVLAAVLAVRLAGRREPARPPVAAGSPSRRPDRRPEGKGPSRRVRGRTARRRDPRRQVLPRPGRAQPPAGLGRGRDLRAGAGRPFRGSRPTRSSTRPGSSRFSFAGQVRVEAGGIVLEGDHFDYDKTAGTFGTAEEGRFASKTMTGRAKGIVYSESAGEIRLGGGFEAVLAAPGGDGGADRPLRRVAHVPERRSPRPHRRAGRVLGRPHQGRLLFALVHGGRRRERPRIRPFSRDRPAST